MCETEGEKELAKVSSRSDARLAGLAEGLAEGLSTPSKSAGARPDALSRFKRHADYNEVYKEAAKNIDDLGRKRLKVDEELANAQVETLKKEAVQVREKEVQASALEKMYRDLREELREAKADDDGDDEIKRIKKELHEIRKLRI